MSPRPEPDERLLAAQLQEALAPAFVLVRRVGTGAMGTVYLGRAPGLRRLVAVKVPAAEFAQNPAARLRFMREAQAVAATSHPNVVAVHSVGQVASGIRYFVMHFVGGGTMADRVATPPTMAPLRTGCRCPPR